MFDLKITFGRGNGSGSGAPFTGAAVEAPEPSGLSALLIGFLVLGRARKRARAKRGLETYLQAGRVPS